MPFDWEKQPWKNPGEAQEDFGEPGSYPDQEPDVVEQAFQEFAEEWHLDEGQTELAKDAFQEGWIACLKDSNRERWTNNRTDLHYINVYSVYRQKGGNEEGGWYYDVGDVVETCTAPSKEEAKEVLKHLEEKYEANKKRWHYGGTWHEARIEDRPGENYPRHTPRYE